MRPDSVRDGALGMTKDANSSRLNNGNLAHAFEKFRTNHYQPEWPPKKSGLTIKLCFSQSMPVAPAPGPS